MYLKKLIYMFRLTIVVAALSYGFGLAQVKASTASYPIASLQEGENSPTPPKKPEININLFGRNLNFTLDVGTVGLIVILAMAALLLAAILLAVLARRRARQVVATNRKLVEEITQRKLAEGTLLENQERTRAIIQTAVDGIITMDHQGRIVDFNPAAERIFGYRSNDVIGRELADVIIPPDLREQHRRGLDHYLATGQGPVLGNRIEINGCRADGSLVMLELSIARMPGGDLPMFTGFLRDITERQEMEEARTRLAAIIESSDDAVIGKTLEGIITSWNRGAEALFGYSTEAAVGKPMAMLIPANRAHEEPEILARIARGKGVNHFETVRVGKGGQHIDVSVSISPIKDTHGKIIGASNIARNITERKRAEEIKARRVARVALRADVNAALAETSSPLRRILERGTEALVKHLGAALACIWTLNKEDSELELQASAGLYTHIDSPHLRVALGASMIGLIAEDLQPHITNEVQGDPRVSHKEWAKQEGMVAFAGYPLIVEDRLVGVMAIFARQRLADDTLDALASVSDIIAQGIERKRVEEALLATEKQLRQSQKLEAVGQLAGGVAHDFNNLLTVITGYSDLLLVGLDRGDPTRLKVEEIKKAGERAASLTRQLLAFSRKQVLQPKVLNPNAIVADTEKMLRRLIGEDVVVLTVLEPSLGQIKADPGQIEQVLLNLTVNARDAMPQGGKLTIETANVYLDNQYARRHLAVRPGNYVMLAVSDTGCGMNAETQARMFEPFFTTKELEKGTGLGLSTVYGIVKQSGGNIWVYSEAGKGTTFKVYLPRVDDVAQIDAPPESPAGLPHGRETVLLAEDEQPVRHLARLILEMNGYQVLEAASGDEAISIYKAHKGRIDLIVTDVVMPRMSGPELAQSLETLCRGIKVLYLSGYTDDAIVRHGLLDRGMAFLQKPFTPEALTRKVREVLDATREE